MPQPRESVILLEIYVCTVFNLLILFQKIHKIYDVLYRLKSVSLLELDVWHAKTGIMTRAIIWYTLKTIALFGKYTF